MPGAVPEQWDFTLLPFEELIVPLLDAVGPEAVLEVGADRGDFTEVLLEWAEGRGAGVTAIDPDPPAELVELARRRPELSLVRRPSLEALPELEPAGAVILDGDHNYHTLSGELELITERAGEDAAMPLLLVHDIGWPHARRDTYYAPERIPESARQPLAEDAMVAPGQSGTAAAGIHFPHAAATEGGARNGILTALEDFTAGRDGLAMATVPAFFGLGVVWPAAAPWSGEVERIVAPWRDSHMLERLEALRIGQIVDRVRMARQEEVLRSMLGSRAFSLVSRLSRLGGRRGRVFSRERVRRALDE